MLSSKCLMFHRDLFPPQSWQVRSNTSMELSKETSVYLAGYFCHIYENSNLPVGQFFKYLLANLMLFRTAM